MRSIDGAGCKLAFIALAALAIAACSDDPTAPAARRGALASVAADSADGNTFAVTPARDTIHVRRGRSDSMALRIVRPAGLTDSAELAIEGAPAGVTATVSPVRTTDSTVTLSVAASDSAAVGATKLTLRAVAGDRKATPVELTLVVRTTAFPDGPASASWTFCDSADAPVWFAHQEGDEAWKRVERTGRRDSVVYAVSAKGRGAIAFVNRSGEGNEEGYELSIFYGTPAELAAFSGARCTPRDTTETQPATGKRLSGSVAGAEMTNQVTVSMGGAFASVMAMQPSFTLRNVAAGPQDLVASLTSFSFDGGAPSFSLSKLIIRRKLDLADGATIPTLDFASAEAFAPVAPKLTVEGAGTAQLMTSVTYQTAGGGTATLFGGLGGDRYYGVPAAKQEKGDMHMLTVMAMPRSAGGDDDDVPGLGGGATSQFADGMRAIVTQFREAKDRTIAIGPELAAPAVTQLAEKDKHVRFLAKIARQAEYGAGLTMQLMQETARRQVSITVTEAYVGDAKEWAPGMPDLSAVDGFDPKWAPRADARVAWTVAAYGGDFFDARGQMFGEGVSYRYAARAGNAVTPARR